MAPSSASAARLVPDALAEPSPLRSPPRNVAVAALERVRADVHSHVPVVAGGNAMPLLEAAYGLGYRPIPTRSELGAGFLANGIAWESGQPTLCLVITSVGVYGLMQALHAAFVNRRPVVVISGEVAGAGCGSVQAGEGWDGPAVTQVTRALTAWSFDATTPELAVRALQRAVLLASTTQKPIHINVPLAVQRSDAP